MARDNKLVQGRLFDRFDMLLSKSGAEQELAECLTEVLADNSLIFSCNLHKDKTILRIKQSIYNISHSLLKHQRCSRKYPVKTCKSRIAVFI